MTETTTRIRWEEDAEADEFIGYIGTLPAYMFLICDDGEPEWLLTSRLPDDEGERCWRAPHPDQLKAEAERWLEEFVSSLGAVFPEEERPHQTLIEALGVSEEASDAIKAQLAEDFKRIRAAETSAPRAGEKE